MNDEEIEDDDTEDEDKYEDEEDADKEAYLNQFINKDSVVSNWVSGSAGPSGSPNGLGFVLIITFFTETSEDRQAT